MYAQAVGSGGLCLLLHLAIVSVVRSQSCNATVFGTDLQEQHSPSGRTGLFFDTQSPASCSGILTRWRYCFYNANAGSEGTVRFSIYRKNSNSYSRVFTNAVKTLPSIPSSPSFTCDTLTPSNTNVQVNPGDIVVTCIHQFRPLDVVAMLGSGSGYQVPIPLQFRSVILMITLTFQRPNCYQILLFTFLLVSAVQSVHD